MTDPATRIAKGLCLILAFGLDHPRSARALTRLVPGTTAIDAPLNELARKDIENGLTAGIMSEIAVEDGLVITIGACMLTLHHALTLDAAALRPRAFAATQAAALLRALGVSFAVAKTIADQAGKEVFGA